MLFLLGEQLDLDQPPNRWRQRQSPSHTELSGRLLGIS